MNHRRLLCGAALAASATAATPAGAQQIEDNGVALQRFYPAPAGDRFFGVPSAYVNGELTPQAMLLADYAHNPLLLHHPDGEGDQQIVGHQMLLHLNGSLALWQRLLVTVDVPIAFQSGGSLHEYGVAFSPPDGAAFGDLMLGLRLRAVGEPDDAFQLAFGTYIWFPTGTDRFVTDETVRGWPMVIVAGARERFVYSAAVGPDIRGTATYLGGFGERTSSVRLGGGAGVLLGDDRAFQLGPELTVSVPVGGDLPQTTDAELLLGGKMRFARFFEAGLGAGAGLTDAVGAPDMRLVGSLAYAPSWEPEDSDRDGVPDAQDPCPSSAGGVTALGTRNGCPSDTDGDGIPDAQDACAETAGDPDADATISGCPQDRDGDGILDPPLNGARGGWQDTNGDGIPDALAGGEGQGGWQDTNGDGIPDTPPRSGGPRGRLKDTDRDGFPDAYDACPRLAGVKNPNPKRNGCPSDKDDDGIPDAKDACADVAGASSTEPSKHGCPADEDGDGIPDAEDGCPGIPGIKSTERCSHGCPGDTDKDGIRDDRDACPKERGKLDPDPKKSGCPQAVRMTEEEIHILEQVQFDTNRATIKPISAALLDEVSHVLDDHPEILKVEVQGHTDNRGARRVNTKLSQQRAEAVVEALVARKIERSRLVPKGYGPDKPIGDNATPEGRQKNRRVQFVILEKASAHGAKKIPALVQPAPATTPPKK